MKKRRKQRPVEERFWEKVQKTETCWLWLAGKVSHGHKYGQFSFESKPIVAHRFSWILHNGPIPDGLLVLHECDNPPCVNPDHLFLGTHADNAADRDKKGRGVFVAGEKHGSARLTEGDIQAIRQSNQAGESYKALADKFAVTRPQISKIIVGRRWAKSFNQTA